MKANGSFRSGWNQRGGTDREIMRDIARRSDPNSGEWVIRRTYAQVKLERLLGDDGYQLWQLVTWSNDDLVEKSEKDLYEDITQALEMGEAVFETLECRCNPASDIRCRVCDAQLQLRQAATNERHWSDDPKHYGGAEY